MTRFGFPPLPHISPIYGIDSVNGEYAVSTGTAAWPATNLAIYAPFTIEQPFLAVDMFIFNAGTISGNTDVGIYAIDGTRLVSSGSTAITGTNTIQTIGITDTLLAPGMYYLAMSVDNTTHAPVRGSLGTVEFVRSAGVFQEALASVTLPAAATFAAAANNYIPFVGVTQRSFV